ncbi:hypothetical protein MTO96_015717 [Rhipicephalus appendiculatus]
MPRQTAAVLWRTLAIESIKRHYVLSFLEVAIVLVLALLFLSTKFVTQPTTEQSQLRQATGSGGEDIAGTTQGVRGRSDGVKNSTEEKCGLYSPIGDEHKNLFHAAFPDIKRAYKMQVALNSAFLRQRDKEDMVNITVRSFPVPEFPEDILRYRYGFFWLASTTFLFPMYRIISRLCFESNSGLREYQLMMGLGNCFYWTGHFACALCFFLVHSALCVYAAVGYNLFDTGAPYLDRTDPSLVFVALLLHSVSQILLAMLAACVFTSVIVATLSTALLSVALPYWVLQSTGSLETLAQFVFGDRVYMLLSSALPTVAAFNVLTVLAIQNDFDGGAAWKKVNYVTLGIVPVTVLDVWVVSLLTVAVQVLLIGYFSNVLPWSTALPTASALLLQEYQVLHHGRAVSFPANDEILGNCLFFYGAGEVKSYWRPQQVEYRRRADPLEYYDPRFEPAPSNFKSALDIVDLSVTYGNNEALKGVSLQAFDKQATVLVGPKRGRKDHPHEHRRRTAETQLGSGESVRRDILFPDMTAWEHLLYFGTLRDMKPGSLKKAAQEALSMTGLEAPTLVSELKKRQTKRLSIAIAAISKPKLVVLDEPTAGMHTLDAHGIWEILLHLRGTVSLFFSTHNMTEADVLADRVVCLSAGIVICNASPTHLKNVYGVGYVMTLSKDTSVPFQRQEVLSVVKRCAPEAAFVRESPVLATRAHLGISSIGLTASTLKDIYLKLTLASVSLSGKTTWAQQLPANLSTLVSTRGWNPGIWRRVSTLMLERLLFLRTRCRHQLLASLMPLVVLVGAFHWMAAGKPERENATAVNIPVPVSLRELYPEARVFLDDDEGAKKGISPYYMHLLEEAGAVVTHYNDTAGDVLLAEAEKDYVSYTKSMVLGAVFRNKELEAWYNPYAIMSKCLAYGLVSSALLAYKEKSYWAHIETTLEVHLPEVVKLERSRRQMGDPGSEYFEDDPMGHVDVLVHKMATIWAFMAPLALFLIVSSFVAFPSAESGSRFMQLQLMTGIPGWLHCLCNLLFDCALFVWIILPTSTAFVLYYDVHMIAYKALFVVFSVSAVLFILSAYVIAYSCKTAFRAYVVAFFVFGVFGALTFFVTVRVATGGHDIGFVCSALPPCAVPMSLIKVVGLDWTRRACRQLALERLDNTSALIAFCRKVADYKATYHEEMFAGLLRTQVDMCCGMMDADLRAQIDWSPLRSSKVGVGLEVYYLCVEALILFVYLSCRNSGRFFRPDSVGNPSVGSTDAEVTKERRTVRRACAEHTVGNYALVAEEVHKWYGEDYAVCAFNLALPRDECFGLLGVYGCGKSSVAQMLAAYTWQSQVGFCPEEDSLLDALSGAELLEVFARLRGVRSDKIERLVECVVGVVDLNEFAKDACGTYSADARRKLSIGLAIIGAPRVVILDDATRGIDTTGRQMIYEALRDLARVSASAIILTSRSTEECDLACTRVGLMAGGEIKALGSMAALRESFSTGFTVTFSLAEKFTSYMIEKSDKAVTQLFPGARRVDCREGTFVYHVANSLPWSEVFSRLNTVSQCLMFESVLVAQSSLDEVLLGMGRAEMAEDATVCRRAVYETFGSNYRGDPWGRVRQLKHERRQKVRERRKKEADKNSTEKAAQ